MAEETYTETKPAPKPEKGEERFGTEAAGQINEIARALKIIEDKYSNLRKKVQVSEENNIAQQKRVIDDIKVIQSDALEIKREIEGLKEMIRLIVRELKLTAKEEDIKVVQKYLDLWEPVQFITREEARKMIERAVDEKFK
jgi:hypothetical protein